MLHVHHDEGCTLITARFDGLVPPDLRVTFAADEVRIGTARGALHVVPLGRAIDESRAMIQVVGDVVCVVLPAARQREDSAMMPWRA
jgi:hypothetical protein